MTTDVRIREVAISYEDYAYRTPIKFGGVALDKVTLLNVNVMVETRSGKMSAGFGSMPLGNVWSFPSRALTYQQTLQAMQRLAGQIERISRDCDETAHPIDLNWLLEPLYLKAADQVRIDLGLVEPIPKLCTLVVASAFDAAIHDGFGKAGGISCYQGYSERYMVNDLGHYLGAEFQGDRLNGYISTAPKPCMPLITWSVRSTRFLRATSGPV